MKKVKVSVLMPAYNVEKYVGAAIESILNQTFTDFEFIIINDGSTDNTAKIIKEYAKKDKRIRFINHTKNKGLIAVLNEGLDLCNGEYIARMDSDDISLPERFAKQVTYMDTNPECGVLGTAIQLFGRLNNIVRNIENVKIFNLLSGHFVAHPTVMMRKSIIDKYNLKYDAKYKHAEDFELWSRMVFITEIHNLNEILLKYRWHEENISVLHSEEQSNVSDRIKQNIINKLTNDELSKRLILDIVRYKNKRRILLPKWTGKIICLFIFKREKRHIFRDKYVKD